ncbi:MAG TPA: hypothetical protein VLB02_02970 [Candidatus Paceibacterota bacterium]|nr:hypothetical protein [Candidatus Paceibacterota bacterium]
MATTKRRLNITLDPALEIAIAKSAKRDRVPEATKAAELLSFALSLEEDSGLEALAKSRDIKGANMIKHTAAWK